MSRRDRQRVELERLCEAGALSRAVDLAFAHFADYGPDPRVLDLLRARLDGMAHTPALRRRFSELCECR